jgi:PAS domain S-box-containing protein
LPRALEVLDEYIKGERETYDPEIRMRTKSGEWKWIQTIGKVIDCDESGAVTRAAGIHLDIHERKEAKRELQQSERRFRKIFENAAIGIVIGDHEGQLQRANPAFQSMIGYEEAGLQGRHFSDITHPDDLAPVQDLFDELIEGKRDRFQIEQRYVRKDGDLFWGRLTVSLLDLENGRKHVALVEDIDEQKHYEAKLREAKNEAEEAARLKTVMLANMSHEVRTPLTSMIGFSGILENQLHGKEAKLVRLIRKSGQRLEETMDAVLELSQLEAGSYTLNQEPLRLDALVTRQIDAFEPQAEKSGVTLTLDTGNDPVDVFADEMAVRRVLSNLLDNALKFTPEGGQVTVRTQIDGPKTVILEVEDTGVGISEDALPIIFDAFKQESEGLTREYEGAGLGLSIVQKLIDALGGWITVDSAKGEGTRVRVHLPRTSGNGSSSTSE